MGLLDIILIGIGLSMDAFAVSICKGLSVDRTKPSNFLSVGLWFGGFQALMPLIGYFLGSSFAKYIEAFDHWVAFILLILIGANMIRESISEKDDDDANSSFLPRSMLPLAVATSIDALAVGISFAMVKFESLSIFSSVGIIGVCTFFISAVGLKIGNVFGSKYKSKAEIAGGIILIIIGLKILLEGLGILNV